LYNSRRKGGGEDLKKPKLAAEKARLRIQKEQPNIERALKAIKSRRPLDAEEDNERKIRRFQAACGVNTDQAKRLADYDETVLNSLTGDRRLAAERIQGKTRDFVGVSFIDLAKAASRTVARVVYRDSGDPIGSGFMISDMLFITNNHVIRNIEDATNSIIEFDYEMDYNERPKTVTRFSLDPDTFFVDSPEEELDFTIVAVGQRISGHGDLFDFGYCPLLNSDDKHVLSEFVNIIQHPEGNYKQIVIRENQLIDREPKFLLYRTDTLPGSSGAPVFNDQWEVVGLHHYGEPSTVRGPDGSKLRTDINEGIRISRIVSDIRSRIDNADESKRLIINKVLQPEFRHPSTLKDNSKLVSLSTRENKPPDDTESNFTERKSDGWVTWKIPLEVSIRFGNTVPPSINKQLEEQKTPTDKPVSFLEKEESISIDTNYENRDGYNPNFLPKHSIPLPKLGTKQKRDAARKKEVNDGEDPYELKYQHFSVVMNAKRRMAFFTAVNIEGKYLISIDRGTGEPRESRPEATERWYTDPRIDLAAQSDQSLYDKQQPEQLFDRGHLVRREDPNWGTAAEAKRANADTFHFTNCSPQAKDFNKGAHLWAGIENYILNNTKAERGRVTVFTGPVLEEDDPKYRYARVPKQFWKILVRVDRGQVHATALLADQSDMIRRLPERMAGERFDDTSEVAKIAQFQTSISNIEDITGLDFGALKNYDTFQKGPEALGKERVKLGDFSDIKLEH
jgi:endonuclease G